MFKLTEKTNQRETSREEFLSSKLLHNKDEKNPEKSKLITNSVGVGTSFYYNDDED